MSGHDWEQTHAYLLGRVREARHAGQMRRRMVDALDSSTPVELVADAADMMPEAVPGFIECEWVVDWRGDEIHGQADRFHRAVFPETLTDLPVTGWGFDERDADDLMVDESTVLSVGVRQPLGSLPRTLRYRVRRIA